MVESLWNQRGKSVKQGKQHREDEKRIEETLKELFGCDDASLEEELAEVQCIWEAELAADPEVAARARAEAEASFERIMARARAEGIRPVSEAEYNKARRRATRDVVYLGKRGKKVLLLVAVVAVFGVGATMVVSARREYEYSIYPVQDQRNSIVKRNAAIKIVPSKLEETYDQIEEDLGIAALRIFEFPKEMVFKQAVINSKGAILEFEYDTKRIYLKQEKYPLEQAAIESKISDRKACQEVYNDWIHQTIVIEENILQDGLAEYSASIDMDNTYYYLSGMTEKEVFVNLVKSLYFK